MERIPFVDGDFNFWELYDSGKWEPETRQVIEECVRPGGGEKIVYDIGAWIGPVSMWAVMAGATQVFAFEPDPIAYPQLMQNTRTMSEILPVNAAVVSGPPRFLGANGHVQLTNQRFFGDSMSRVTARQDVPSTAVPAISINQVFNDYPAFTTPRLVKVDIEGGEIDILPFLAPYCHAWHIPLFVSWHQPWWPNPAAAENRQRWFTGFSELRGGWNGFETLLALP